MRKLALLMTLMLALGMCVFAEEIDLTRDIEVELTLPEVEELVPDAEFVGESTLADNAAVQIPARLKLGVGETLKLGISGAIFSTGKPSVATVSKKGTITALKTGTAKITVTSGGKKLGTCTVKVLKAPSKVTLNKAKATLEVGQTLQLKAKLPSKTASNRMKWASSKKKVATVDAEGLVTAVAPGTAKITVKTFNGKKKTCTVTVKERSPDVGELVEFGYYDQDNDPGNGKEPITWQVFEKKNGTLTLISLYALDCRPYNEEYGDVTWKTCTLRKWLNGEFLDDAFTAKQQERIKQVKVPAEDNPNYGTEAGSDTKDKVWLLSLSELERVFPYDDVRACQPTDTAFAHGAWRRNGYFCDWWLRTPGEDQSRASCVEFVKDYGPSLNPLGYGVGRTDKAVRPVICFIIP